MRAFALDFSGTKSSAAIWLPWDSKGARHVQSAARNGGTGVAERDRIPRISSSVRASGARFQCRYFQTRSISDKLCAQPHFCHDFQSTLRDNSPWTSRSNPAPHSMPGWLALRTAPLNTSEHEHLEEMTAFSAQTERLFSNWPAIQKAWAIGPRGAQSNGQRQWDRTSRPSRFLENLCGASGGAVSRGYWWNPAMSGRGLRGCREFASDALLDNT